jgi:hypothetical protein
MRNKKRKETDMRKSNKGARMSIRRGRRKKKDTSRTQAVSLLFV